MKKFIIRLAVLGMVVLSATSCGLFGGGGTPDPYKVTDLKGIWLEEGTKLHHIHFTSEVAPVDSLYDSQAYLVGCEWNESEDVHEADLQESRDYYGHLTDGWFAYSISGTTLSMVHFMDNGGANIPKTYTLQSLTADQLQYKDGYGKVHTFQKLK